MCDKWWAAAQRSNPLDVGHSHLHLQWILQTAAQGLFWPLCKGFFFFSLWYFVVGGGVGIFFVLFCLSFVCLFCCCSSFCFCLESELGYHRDASLTSDSVELYFRHWFALTGRKYFCLIRINHFKVEDEDDPGRVPLTSLVDASCPQLMWEPYSHADGTGHVCTE